MLLLIETIFSLIKIAESKSMYHKVKASSFGKQGYHMVHLYLISKSENYIN